MSVIKRFLLPAAMIALVPVITLAASEYEECSREEQRLRKAEAADCSGMSYIFNPNACFITRKLLLPYDNGKCRSLAGKKEAELQRPATAALPSPAAEKQAETVLPGQPAAVAVLVPAAEPSVAEIDLLRQEVAGLKLELQRLKDEVARLRGVR